MIVPLQPIFGVVLPTYNRLDMCLRALHSVYSQRYTYWKLIIVDDSNNDLTQHYFVEHPIMDDRVCYIKNNHNSGVSFSRNRGVELLLDVVDYIVFLDDDDYFDQFTFQNTAKAIVDTMAAPWLVSRRINCNTNQSITRVKVSNFTHFDYIRDCLIRKRFKKDATHFIQTRLIQKAGARFDSEIRTGGEWRFYVQLALQSQFIFFEGGHTYGDYLIGGLTHQNQKENHSRYVEKKDLLDFLAKHQIHLFKQMALMLSLLRYAKRIHIPRIREDLYQIACQWPYPIEWSFNILIKNAPFKAFDE